MAGDERDDATSASSAAETYNEQLKERKSSWGKLRRVDSLNLEAGRVSHNHVTGVRNSFYYTLIQFVIRTYIYISS